MTIEEYNRKLDVAAELIADAKTLFFCYSEAHKKKVNRLFLKGLLYYRKQLINWDYTSEAYIKKRKKRGLPTNRVDLRFNTNLQRDHATSLSRDGQNWVSGFKNQNPKKLQGLYDMFGDKVFWHTSEEIEEINKCVSWKIDNILSFKDD